MNDAFGINNLSTCIELSMENEKNINGYMSKKEKYIADQTNI